MIFNKSLNAIKYINLTQKYVLILSLIGLLLPENISSFILILFVFFSLIKIIIENKINYKLNKIYYIYLGFFAIFILSCFFSNETQIAFRSLQKNIVWLVLPILFSLSVSLNEREKFYILLKFALISQAYAIFIFLSACYKFYNGGEINVFFYDDLTTIINFHPVYFSLYLLFSLSTIIVGYQKNVFKCSIYLILLLFIFDSFLLILLSSKNILLIFFILSIFFVFKHYNNRNWFVITFILLIFMFKSSITGQRFQDSIFSKWELLSKNTYSYDDEFTGVTLRLITWKLVISSMNHEDYILGIGSGDSQNFIDNTYKKYKMDGAGYLGYNMHNQFLEYFLRFGIVGISLYSVILFVSFKKAIEDRNFLYLIFLFSFSSLSLTESNLQVHRGLVYFVLFNSLFYFSNTPKKISI
ncbi:hypothetical protein Celal_1573 [Cellulophaga algicola DSM 14237]|uniref:O-antigen ligase-related domain-containing protein n=1 Tax=Cellulophaga algicola (strain DSM 14237 / IC166 / ACAM 630) TaxID=688270 RepID=E6XB28_CELAD|nr:O-antigen ligase family protein [Cellulophaga algicola]ADV48884.1 hypothetical protein Celal_1573 [Cellulophaga algicola DSM 14237]